MAQPAASYYRGFVPQVSSPTGTGPAGAMADVTGTSLPTASAVIYTPPTSATDSITIAGVPILVTFNTSATQTVTDTKALIALNGTLSTLVKATGTTTLVITALAPGDVGDGIPVTSTNAHGASFAASFTNGGGRWFGQGGGASPSGGGVLANGSGALVTGIGYGTNMTPVLARTSNGTVTSRQVGSGLDVQALLAFGAERLKGTQVLATSTWTPLTSGSGTVVINGTSLTVAFSVNAETTAYNVITQINSSGAIQGIAYATYNAATVVVTGVAGQRNNLPTGVDEFGNGITTTTTGTGASFSASATAGGANKSGEDSATGVVNAVGSDNALLIANVHTYTPPTSSTDTLIINGKPFTVTFATSATVTVTNLTAVLEAITWINDLFVITGTTTLILTARNTGVGGNAIVVTSAALNGASIANTPLGGTTGKQVRLVESTGTVTNGSAVISGWLNEYAGGVAGDLSGGTLSSGYVVVGRAS